jgi:hypothetical protein
MYCVQALGIFTVLHVFKTLGLYRIRSHGICPVYHIYIIFGIRNSATWNCKSCFFVLSYRVYSVQIQGICVSCGEYVSLPNIVFSHMDLTLTKFCEIYRIAAPWNMYSFKSCLHSFIECTKLIHIHMAYSMWNHQKYIELSFLHHCIPCSEIGTSHTVPW